MDEEKVYGVAAGRCFLLVSNPIPIKRVMQCSLVPDANGASQMTLDHARRTAEFTGLQVVKFTRDLVAKRVPKEG